jgi:hypothetical protein
VRAEGDHPALPDRAIVGLMRVVAGPLLADSERAVAVLRDSERDWTVVRAPRLTNAAGTGTWRTGMVGRGTGRTIPRADIAAFMLEELTDRRFVRHLPMVSA